MSLKQTCTQVAWARTSAEVGVTVVPRWLCAPLHGPPVQPHVTCPFPANKAPVSPFSTLPQSHFRCLSYQYYYKGINWLYTWALSISGMTITASHYQTESSLSKLTGLGQSVWCIRRSHVRVCVRGLWVSLHFLPGSPISSTCELLSCSLSTSLSFFSFTLSLPVSCFLIFFFPSFSVVRPGVWKDTGSPPTFHPRHNLLLGLHLDV